MKSVILALLLVSTSLPALAKSKEQVFDLQVTENGFEPSSIDAKPGIPVVLNVTRKTDATCATQIKVKNIKKDLPLNKPVKITLGKLEKGEVRFACGMNMLSGQILVK